MLAAAGARFQTRDGGLRNAHALGHLRLRQSGRLSGAQQLAQRGEFVGQRIVGCRELDRCQSAGGRGGAPRRWKYTRSAARRIGCVYSSTSKGQSICR